MQHKKIGVSRPYSSGGWKDPLIIVFPSGLSTRRRRRVTFVCCQIKSTTSSQSPRFILPLQGGYEPSPCTKRLRGWSYPSCLRTILESKMWVDYRCCHCFVAFLAVSGESRVVEGSRYPGHPRLEGVSIRRYSDLPRHPPTQVVLIKGS